MTRRDNSSGTYLYAVEFPKNLKTNDTANLVVETVQTHAIHPWPEEASQKDDQTLQYEADLFILSPYPTLVQRTKIKYVVVYKMSSLYSRCIKGLRRQSC